MNFLEALNIVRKDHKNIGLRPINDYWENNLKGCCYSINKSYRNYLVFKCRGTLKDKNHNASLLEIRDIISSWELVDEKILNKEYFEKIR